MPRAQRSRSGLTRAIVVGVVLLAMAAAMVGGVILLRERVDLRPESERLLRALGQGRAEEVYASSSPKLQELMQKEKFVEIVDIMNESLGTFQRTIDVPHSELHTAPSGTTARIVLDLQFSKARTSGELSFHKLGGKWLLLGFRVSIPRNKSEEVANLERAPERTIAPQEVRDAVQRIGVALAEGRVDDVYQLTSPPFRQSVSLQELRGLVLARERSMGKFRRIASVTTSAQNKEKDRAQVEAVLELERSEAIGRFEFVKTENGQWLLSGFKIQARRSVVSEQGP